MESWPKTPNLIIGDQIMKKRMLKKLTEKLPNADAKGRTVYLSNKNKRRICRVDQYFFDERDGDPIMDASGCLGEFIDAWRRKDLNDGCSSCMECAYNGL